MATVIRILVYEHDDYMTLRKHLLNRGIKEGCIIEELKIREVLIQDINDLPALMLDPDSTFTRLGDFHDNDRS